MHPFSFIHPRSQLLCSFAHPSIHPSIRSVFNLSIHSSTNTSIHSTYAIPALVHFLIYHVPYIWIQSLPFIFPFPQVLGLVFIHLSIHTTIHPFIHPLFHRYGLCCIRPPHDELIRFGAGSSDARAGEGTDGVGRLERSQQGSADRQRGIPADQAGASRLGASSRAKG